MLRRDWLWAAVASLALGLTQPAQAQPSSRGAETSQGPAPAPEVDPHDPFEVGRVAFDAGRLGQALNAFETAYTLRHEPRALYRVADTADKLGEHARAISAFQEYLRLEPTSRERPIIQSRILANQAALGGAAGPAAPTPPTAAARGASLPVLETAPAQVARAGTPAASGAPAPAAASAPAASSSPTGPVWVWVGAGALSVAAIVVAGVLVGSSSASSTPTPVRGNVGGTLQTLGAP